MTDHVPAAATDGAFSLDDGAHGAGDERGRSRRSTECRYERTSSTLSISRVRSTRSGRKPRPSSKRGLFRRNSSEFASFCDRSVPGFRSFTGVRPVERCGRSPAFMCTHLLARSGGASLPPSTVAASPWRPLPEAPRNGHARHSRSQGAPSTPTPHPPPLPALPVATSAFRRSRHAPHSSQHAPIPPSTLTVHSLCFDRHPTDLGPDPPIRGRRFGVSPRGRRRPRRRPPRHRRRRRCWQARRGARVRSSGGPRRSSPRIRFPGARRRWFPS